MSPSILQRIFGGGTTSPTPKAKVAVDMNNISSPFLFLTTLGEDQIDIAHRAISSQLILEMKRNVILALIGSGKEVFDEYREWVVQLGERIPHDVLELIDPEKRVADLARHGKFKEASNLAYKSSIRAGARMKEFTKMASDKTRLNLAFDNAAEILKQWTEQRESEKKSVNTDSPISQRDEEYYDSVETISAKSHNKEDWTIVAAPDAHHKANPEPQKISHGSSPISSSPPPGFDSSNLNDVSSNLFFWDASHNFYVMKEDGTHEMRDYTAYFNSLLTNNAQNGVPESQEKRTHSYAQAVSKDTKTPDFNGKVQQQVSADLSKLSPEQHQVPVERPSFFGKSAMSAAFENRENSAARSYPSNLTEEEQWKTKFTSELAAFERNPTVSRNSYASVVSKPIVSSASITPNDNKDSSKPLNGDDSVLNSYEKHFLQQIENSDFRRHFNSTTDDSKAISQSPIRRSMEIENIPGRGDNEDWIANNEEEKKRGKQPSIRSSEAVLTAAGDEPRTRSMSRSRRTNIRPTSRSRSPLKPIPSHPVVSKRSESPPKPLPPAPAPRKRSESPKFKATRQPKVDALNILLLGETGVGKTTFINGLANYLKFKTLDGAMEGEPTILVDASFTITEKNNKPRTIVAKANTGVDQETIKLNERLGAKGTSSTQEPVDHLFGWMDGGEKKLVRIVDTPGINDTRGAEQDAKNFDKILKHIAELGELRAVCIVMKPNESKFTVGFRYCLDELLVKLHKSVTKNIVFCFTNTRSTLYRPGDTLSTLHEYLKKVKKETDVCIAANRSNIFCYDNDTFRYLCVLRQLPNTLTETTELSTKATFSDGWLHNVKEAEMMLKRVQSLTAHVVEDMVAIDKARKVVTELARPLGEIARNQVVNMQMIKDQMKEIENLKMSGRALDELLAQEEVTMEHVPLSRPRTVCNARKCIEYVKVNEFDMFTDHVTICHDPCLIPGIEQMSFNNSALRGCQVFDRKGDCRGCGCSWVNHMHIKYELKHKMVTRMDREAFRKLEQCSNKKQRAEMALYELKEKLERLDREQEQIRESCAEFSAFLSTNCLKLSCDPFADYLRHLSDDENVKCESGGGNVDIAVAVCLMCEDYENRVKNIKEEIKSGRRSALSTRQLNAKIANLAKLKLCGNIIAALMNEHLKIAEMSVESAPSTSKQGPPKDLIQEVVNEKNTDSKPKVEEKKNTNEQKKTNSNSNSNCGKKGKNKGGRRK